MKKLIIAACAVAMAVCANAATTKWAITTGSSGAVYNAGTTDVLAGTLTAYVFCAQTADTATTATVLTQAALLTALRNGDAIGSLGAITSVTMTDGAIASTQFTTDAFATGKSTKMYFAVISDDDVYISGLGTKTSNATTPQTLTINPTTSSQAALNSFETAFGSAGWYATAPVPEPTSGLLLLLGMAGLALKRKRA